jgi:hypothetical protein
VGENACRKSGCTYAGRGSRLRGHSRPGRTNRTTLEVEPATGISTAGGFVRSRNSYEGERTAFPVSSVPHTCLCSISSMPQTNHALPNLHLPLLAKASIFSGAQATPIFFTAILFFFFRLETGPLVVTADSIWADLSF